MPTHTRLNLSTKVISPFDCSKRMTLAERLRINQRYVSFKLHENELLEDFLVVGPNTANYTQPKVIKIKDEQFCPDSGFPLVRLDIFYKELQKVYSSIFKAGYVSPRNLERLKACKAPFV